MRPDGRGRENPGGRWHFSSNPIPSSPGRDPGLDPGDPGDPFLYCRVKMGRPDPSRSSGPGDDGMFCFEGEHDARSASVKQICAKKPDSVDARIASKTTSNSKVCFAKNSPTAPRNAGDGPPAAPQAASASCANCP